MITPLYGLAHCHDCGRAWYSSAFIYPKAAEAASCDECGSTLECLPAEPFGEGPLFVPAEWVAAEPRS